MTLGLTGIAAAQAATTGWPGTGDPAVVWDTPRSIGLAPAGDTTYGDYATWDIGAPLETLAAWNLELRSGAQLGGELNGVVASLTVSLDLFEEVDDDGELVGAVTLELADGDPLADDFLAEATWTADGIAGARTLADWAETLGDVVVASVTVANTGPMPVVIDAFEINEVPANMAVSDNVIDWAFVNWPQAAAIRDAGWDVGYPEGFEQGELDANAAWDLRHADEEWLPEGGEDGWNVRVVNAYDEGYAEGLIDGAAPFEQIAQDFVDWADANGFDVEGPEALDHLRELILLVRDLSGVEPDDPQFVAVLNSAQFFRLAAHSEGLFPDEVETHYGLGANWVSWPGGISDHIVMVFTMPLADLVRANEGMEDVEGADFAAAFGPDGTRLVGYTLQGAEAEALGLTDGQANAAVVTWRCIGGLDMEMIRALGFTVFQVNNPNQTGGDRFGRFVFGRPVYVAMSTSVHEFSMEELALLNMTPGWDAPVDGSRPSTNDITDAEAALRLGGWLVGDWNPVTRQYEGGVVRNLRTDRFVAS